MTICKLICESFNRFPIICDILSEKVSVSSANIDNVVFVCVGISDIKIINNNGHKIDP